MGPLLTNVPLTETVDFTCLYLADLNAKMGLSLLKLKKVDTHMHTKYIIYLRWEASEKKWRCWNWIPKWIPSDGYFPRQTRRQFVTQHGQVTGIYKLIETFGNAHLMTKFTVKVKQNNFLAFLVAGLRQVKNNILDRKDFRKRGTSFAALRCKKSWWVVWSLEEEIFASEEPLSKSKNMYVMLCRKMAARSILFINVWMRKHPIQDYN